MTSTAAASDGFVRVMRLDELPPGRIALVLRDGVQLAVTRAGDELFAVVNECTHAGTSFERGRAAACQLTCPMHGARFDLRSGACLNAPYRPLTRHAVRVVDGYVEIGPPLVAG